MKNLLGKKKVHMNNLLGKKEKKEHVKDKSKHEHLLGAKKKKGKKVNMNNN